MEEPSIQNFNVWKSYDGSAEPILATSRQIAHLSGLSLKPKGRLKKEGNSLLLKFSVSPKPLKWKGISGWERVYLIIKHEDGNPSFIAVVDGIPVSAGPMTSWQPVRRAADVIEKVCRIIKKQK